MYLYIIRHGHPVYSPVEMLTEEGHKQARALAPRLVQSGITRIYSSPLRRAIETAQPTADALGLPINIEPWTSEDVAWSRFHVEYPDGRQRWIFEVDDTASFMRGKNHDALDKWYEIEPMKYVVNAKEGYEQLMAESDEFLARHGYERDGNEYIVRRHNDERIAVFCHEGFSLGWLSHLLRIPPNIYWCQFKMTHTGVTILRFVDTDNGRTVPKVMGMSDMSHIYADPETPYLFNTRWKV